MSECEKIREAFACLRFIQARAKIENHDSEAADIATVRSFFDSLRTRILEKFPRPE